MLPIVGCLDSDYTFDTVDSVGDQLVVTQGRFDPLPLTLDEARDQGWIEADSCLPEIGHQFILVDDEGWASPLVLIFDGRGRLLGTKVESRTYQRGPLWEHLPDGQPGRDFEHWAQYAYYRHPAGACAATADVAVPGSLGDRLTLSRQVVLDVPLTLDEAWDRGWDTVGVAPNCVPEMGIHMESPFQVEGPPAVIALYDASGRLVGYEMGSEDEQPTPPWEYHEDGPGHMAGEYWSLHMYVRDPIDACSL